MRTECGEISIKETEQKYDGRKLINFILLFNISPCEVVFSDKMIIIFLLYGSGFSK